MKLEVFANAAEVASRAADILEGRIKTKPDIVLGLPTGSTPVGMYRELQRRCSAGQLSFEQVRTFNLDEYYPVSPDNECSYRYFMDTNLFCGIDIKRENTHVPAGNAPDIYEECLRYDAAIEQAGGIDLQVLGVGRNGHIGFNEPDSRLASGTHLTGLTEDTVQANARFFSSADEVPRQAVTMGLGGIMKARSILLLCTGKEKHRALHKLLEGEISTDWPVTMLNMHPDVTVLCDRDAYEKLYLGIDVGGMSIKYGVVNQSGMIYRFEETTDRSSAEQLLEQMTNTCRRITKQYTIAAVGISMPGRIALDGTVNRQSNLPFKGVDVRGYIEREVGVPTTLENDANAAAWGEYMASGEKGDMLMLTLGTGIGSGIVINGRIYRGSHGHAGEFGHMITHSGGRECGCGQRGCFEKYASVAVLIDSAQQAAAENPDSILAGYMGDKANGRSFFEAVAQGCPVAEKVLDTYITELKTGIESIKSIFDPKLVVIGGGISEQKDIFFARLSEACRGVDLRQAVLGNDAGMIGAADLAMRRCSDG
ncbi:MAG: glucosamine-6-phosphate deaminase [Clostridia bacterium]|nr:glucosamine-6-phosphate deaminase [Clostridia bacterium]